MIYLVWYVILEFTAVQTETPQVFTVQEREVTREQMYISKEEAVLNYARLSALAPYVGIKKIRIDTLFLSKKAAAKSKELFVPKEPKP